MKKQFKQPKKESQIAWKNTTHDPKFNPFKKYFACVKIGDKSYLYEYESKFRSEATIYFNEEARLAGGYVETIGIYK